MELQYLYSNFYALKNVIFGYENSGFFRIVAVASSLRLPKVMQFFDNTWT